LAQPHIKMFFALHVITANKSWASTSYIFRQTHYGPT
jgi:hypothetical protein